VEENTSTPSNNQQNIIESQNITQIALDSLQQTIPNPEIQNPSENPLSVTPVDIQPLPIDMVIENCLKNWIDTQENTASASIVADSIRAAYRNNSTELVLYGASITTLPSCISYLNQLVSITLQGTLRSLPPEIGNLQNL